MTRRKKPEQAVRNHWITVRLNDVEFENVHDAAKDAKMSISEYVRHLAVFGKAEMNVQIVADFPKLKELAAEFSSIGNNLNQLTRYFHMGGLRSKAMMEELTRCINEIMEMRDAVMEMAGDYRGYLETYRK